ncbi:MAG TPA: metal ABC transporter ATP-binding protein [Gemmatimonadales bacterium]|nr:metal ABC transporter ATP-binding protein [Gemmatimonadales bacterium]
MTPNALEVEGLGVRFGGTPALAGVSFVVPQGGTLAVIGPNGSGKTVLFKALIGAVRHEGEIRWAEGTRIGYVPQKLDIERDLPITGFDFLRAKAAVVRAREADIRRSLKLVNLTPKVAARPIGTFSGGQFQRLLLAFAVMGQPTVLLFDEPTAGVDEPGEESLYAMIRRLQKDEQLTLLLISHELALVYQHADTVLCLSAGHRTAFFGAPEDVLTPERLRDAYRAPLKFHVHDDHFS